MTLRRERERDPEVGKSRKLSQAKGTEDIQKDLEEQRKSQASEGLPRLHLRLTDL